MSFLEIKNLHVEVEGKQILNGLTLSIEKGQVAAIMGPNGSGKSTLAYVLAGKDSYNVTGGDVLLDGESILEMKPDERAAKGVFLAFQYPVEVPGVATMTFLRTALNAQRKTRGEGELSTPEFIKLVGLAGFEKAFPYQMSGGMQQRCGLARALAVEPNVLLMDEPFAAVDAQTRADLEDLVRGLLRQRGITILFVTHDIDEAVYLGERVLVLSASPTVVQEQLKIDLPVARDQLHTRAAPRFTELRTHVYEQIQAAKRGPH